MLFYAAGQFSFYVHNMISPFVAPLSKTGHFLSMCGWDFGTMSSNHLLVLYTIPFKGLAWWLAYFWVRSHTHDHEAMQVDANWITAGITPTGTCYEWVCFEFDFSETLLKLLGHIYVVYPAYISGLLGHFMVQHVGSRCTDLWCVFSVLVTSIAVDLQWCATKVASEFRGPLPWYKGKNHAWVSLFKRVLFGEDFWKVVVSAHFGKANFPWTALQY